MEIALSLVFHPFLAVMLTSLLCFRGVVGNEYRIKNALSFINFSKNVNKGTNYEGTTVLLYSDLSLSTYTIAPIGVNYTCQFKGVFDGQGHIISDLKINSTSQYTGLFGYSTGLITRNVVLDSSCSIKSSYSGSSDVYVGGIIGYCSGQYNIENNVNMAAVTFNGDISKSNYYLRLGGIVGQLSSSYSYNSYVKNCANYGSVTHSGTSGYSRIGGVVGYLYGSNSNYKYIYNSLNYGTITHSGTTSSSLYLGGIVGDSYYAYIENCVSGGEISIQNTPSTSYIGSIVGYAYSNTNINYCYYTSKLNKYGVYGYGTGKPSISYVLKYYYSSFILNDTVSIGDCTMTSLVDALNAYSNYYILCNHSNWLLNKNSKTVKFTINSRASPITMNSQIILLPNLASEGNISFDGWYDDKKYENPLGLFKITENKTLYGRFEENISYTITFDTSGLGYIAPLTARFGEFVSLPTHCISSWKTECGGDVGLNLTMPARNFTLHAVCKCIYILNASDFTTFVSNVNSGTNYEGTTVLLDSDLSFSGITPEPIGKDTSNYFRGVFDGQGHIISNLTIKSILQYTGLFGYSTGLTIRNVVLGSSCSITSSFSGSGATYVGGIIGGCSSGQCNIENNVNMAAITFTGDISSYSYLGGIVGQLSSSYNYNSYVNNSANYGSVTHSGASGYSRIGGVVGYLYGSYSYYKYLYNSLNYGTITHNGTTSTTLGLGGIVGYSNYAYIENCVSAGKISTKNAPSKSYVGTIVGQVSSYTYIKNCYYTIDASISSTYAYSTPTLTETPKTPSVVNSTLIRNLNNYAQSINCSEWLLNTDDKTVNFTVNDGNALSLSSQLVLLPDPAGDGEQTFSGWYTDPNLTSPLTLFEVNSDTNLYGVLCASNYVVTLDLNGGNASSIPQAQRKAVVCNDTYRGLSTPSRTGYTFTGWHTEKEGGVKVEPGANVADKRDHTLHAQWTINNYIITFDFDNGTKYYNLTLPFESSIAYPPDPIKTGYTFCSWSENITTVPADNLTIKATWTPNNYIVTFDANGGSDVPNSTKEVTFDSSYGDLPTPTKEGHTFTGWFTVDNKNITDEPTVKVPNNHTLYAHWTINNYTITFDFDNGTEYHELTLPFEFNTSITYPSNPTKTGYTFCNWTENITTMPARKINITALWIINNYTLTFIFYDGNVTELVLSYNEEIIYPENLEREGYTFDGWNITTTLETMPAHNITIKALWIHRADNKESSLVIAIGVPVVVAVIVALIVIVLILYFKKRIDAENTPERKVELARPLIERAVQPDRFSRAGVTPRDELDAETPTEASKDILVHLYPRDYTRPSMRDALLGAELTNKQVDLICGSCGSAASRAMEEECAQFEGFTEEDAAAVAMYTYDFGEKDFECNPHRIVNKNIVGRNYISLQRTSGILYLVMTALRKLPRYAGRTLYRGVKGEVNLGKGYYCKGNVITWPALSSTSLDMEETKKSLAMGSADGKAVGTLFIIEGGWGYDVRPYSLYPDEAEVLLEPERQFVVVSVAQSDDLTVITLQMLDTPLILPDVFGGMAEGSYDISSEKPL